MKIPIRHLDLSELGYEGYWVDMPRSIREGDAQAFGLEGRINPDLVGAAKTEAEREAGRRVNIRMLELVVNWNLDDDDGKPYPLPRNLKTQEQKEKILAELPIDVLVHLAENLQGANKKAVPDNVVDFSNRS